jgi:hypothetical protein
MVLIAVLACYAGVAGTADESWTNEQRAKLFQGSAKVSFTADYMVIESNCLPNHPTATYPNKDNPNSIVEQKITFYIPLKPVRAAKPVATPFGPIGVALNGIPFYNQYNGQGQDAVRLEVFDSCCGHPDQRGLYHYHKFPSCLKSPFPVTAGGHSPIAGFMFDGYAIYGPNGKNGKPPQDLDECNGHTDSVRGYHYHATEAYPYLIGGYRGMLPQWSYTRG